MAYIPYNERRFKIIFYEKTNGERPAELFLNSLDYKMRAKLLGLLELLEEMGNSLREPYSKHLEDGIFEIRCKVGTNLTRVMYFFYFDGKIVLTNGFIKKSQKTPVKELAIAKKSRNDFLERMGNNENS